jgi:hypothetical protein
LPVPLSPVIKTDAVEPAMRATSPRISFIASERATMFSKPNWRSTSRCSRATCRRSARSPSALPIRSTSSSSSNGLVM